MLLSFMKVLDWLQMYLFTENLLEIRKNALYLAPFI